MKERTKKGLIIACLGIVCVLLIFGINRLLYKELVQTMTGEDVTEEPEIVTEEERPATEEPKELVIETEPEAVRETETGTQELQPEIEKTEEEKPADPPTLSEAANLTDPDKEPDYEEEPEPAPDDATPPHKEDTPAHGATQDGMIYVDGFGWIPNEGGGGSGSNADDMYENGNKVGIMD